MDEAKFARYGLLGGVGFVVLIVVGAFIGGQPPMLSDSDRKILEYFEDNQDALRIGAYLAGLGMVFFLWFLGSLFGRLRRAEGGAGRVSSVALSAGVLALAISAVANAITAYTALHPETGPGGYRLASVLLGYTGFALAAFTAGVSIVLWSQNVLPKWFAYAGEVVAVAWFVAAAGVATESDAIFTIGFVVFLVWVIWVAALSIQLYRAPEAA